MASFPPQPFKPALLIVDFQQDFCPPNGAIPVPQGRTIAPLLNTLLSLPFAVKIATRDTHPRDHVSFAENHSAVPFTSTTEVVHPSDPSRSYTTTLWPVHCLSGSPGAELLPELHVAELHHVLDKGADPRLEMYSAFRDPFGLCDSGLTAMLRAAAVTDVFVGGLAGDYCVRATAEHAVEDGFRTYVVDEATRPAWPDRWEDCKRDMASHGVHVVSIDGAEVAWVKALLV